ncbi:hypothetical protein S101395_04158 [Bacillus sonorensis]|uniref:Uncharacterized protein n=1 Tax=Bacillus sonorensis TaxID=119858 RepID=A0ABN5ANB5_9BACI|nr:hypothetical protein S101395_04158 [Bacillus sonorensis]
MIVFVRKSVFLDILTENSVGFGGFFNAIAFLID